MSHSLIHPPTHFPLPPLYAHMWNRSISFYMTDDIACWRARIGCFNGRVTSSSKRVHFKSVSLLHSSLLICCLVFLYWSLKFTVSFLREKHNVFSKLLQISKDIVTIICLLLLLLSGDIHPNPGPSTFNFMHYNVNSLKAHNFTRVRLLEAHMNVHNLDLAAITESALDDTVRK